MGKATAILPVSDRSASSSRVFLLEQAAWPQKYASTFGEFIKALGVQVNLNNYGELYSQFRGQCDADGDMVPALRVYLADLAMPYTLRASYGELGRASLVTDTRIDYLEFELDSEQSVEFGTITKANWEGQVFDATGQPITAPAITLTGNTAKVGQEVDGTMAIEYLVSFWRHELRITPRTPTEAQAAASDFDISDLYASTVRCFCNGEVQRLQIEMPEDFGNCAGSNGSGMTRPDDEEPESTARTYQVTFEAFDYCTGKPLPDATIYVDGVVVAGAMELTGGAVYQLKASASGYVDSDADDLLDNDELRLAE